MTTLVVGASGATGRLLVEQLLNRREFVRIIVRTANTLPETVTNHENLSIIHASILDLSDAELVQHIKGCNAVASCLGHNLNFKGLYGHPRRLVTDATRRLCLAIKATKPEKPVKFVLMNTAGNSNRDLSEPISFAQNLAIWLLRVLLPPHVDNEKAADFLRTGIGQNDNDIEWVAVRPDNLTNQDTVTEYDEYPSPIRSALFNPGTTSRINVAHFMADLITNHETWNNWRGQMPVIYNKTDS
jgi:nucleoside-diphosphate-sugar epimerase